LTEKKQILNRLDHIRVTIVSRILGYVRDQRIAFLLGTLYPRNSFIWLTGIPNLFRRLWRRVDTAPSSRFFDVYAGEVHAEVGFANRSFGLWRCSRDITSGNWCFASVIQVFTADASNVPGIKREPEPRDLPLFVFVALAALGHGILNCFHMFGLPAATPVFLNLAVILFSVGAVWRTSRTRAFLAVVSSLGAHYSF